MSPAHTESHRTPPPLRFSLNEAALVQKWHCGIHSRSVPAGGASRNGRMTSPPCDGAYPGSPGGTRATARSARGCGSFRFDSYLSEAMKHQHGSCLILQADIDAAKVLAGLCQCNHDRTWDAPVRYVAMH
jgi:hypothetical protein